MTLFSEIEATLNETRNQFIYELQREEGVCYIDDEEEFDDEEED